MASPAQAGAKCVYVSVFYPLGHLAAQWGYKTLRVTLSTGEHHRVLDASETELRKGQYDPFVGDDASLSCHQLVQTWL